MHRTFVNDDGDRRVYTESIPMERSHGYVKVKNKYCETPKGSGVNLKIARHSENTVKIVATLSKAEAIRIDPSCPGSEHYLRLDYKEYEWLWTPWWTDEILKSIDQYRKREREATLRGGNRLLIDIREPGDYTVWIPNDCDIDVRLEEGDIEYLVSRDRVATSLVFTATKINRWGESGFYNPGCIGEPAKESWSYYWGKETDPRTNLKTKKGNGKIPL